MLNIYRASAGSGKTYQLTLEYIRLLFETKSSYPHRHIMAVTFTNKATDEMKSRILKELYALSSGQKSDFREKLMELANLSENKVNELARQILIEILHDYSFFSVSTIDRFFQQVIRSFAREIGVNGSYNLELDTTLTLQQATDNLFLNLSEKENKQLLNWLTEFAEERINEGKSWNIKREISKLGNEIFKENYQYKAEQTSKKLHDKDFINAYRKRLQQIISHFDNTCKAIALRALDLFVRYGLQHEYFPYSCTKVFERLLNGSEKELKITFRKMAEDVTNCYSKSKPQHIKSAIEDAYVNGLRDCIVELISLYDNEYSERNTAAIILKNLSMLGILSDLALQIKQLMEEQNTLLMSDTNMLLNKIIDDSDTPFIYEKTGMFVDHFMIDEFQDTSVLQWKNFYPLLNNSLANGNDNLLVGDVKQSIYRWRNSDWKLLDKEVFEQFNPEQIKTENLDTNWRSDKNIVAFNNLLFTDAPQKLQSILNENIGKNPQLLDEFGNKITHAYENTIQKNKPNAGEGYVKIEFLPKKNEDDINWEEQSLEKLPIILEKLQDKGFQPNETAILVRKRTEAQSVVQKLLSYKKSGLAKEGYCYDIMGNEGLLVSSSASVRFLLSVLRLFVNPQNHIEKVIVNYEYLVAKGIETSETALRSCFVNDDEVLFPLFSDEENKALNTIRHLTLFEMVEQLIVLFGVDKWNNDTVFVQAFQDIVYQFSVGKTAGLNDFLNWWDDNADKQFVSVPENQRAFRVMTIHKSKGLDFDAVVMPFAEWSLDSTRNKNILWCETNQEPYNELPLLPVEYSSMLKDSVFSEAYLDEQMHQFIDSLNIAYVAFTRAKHQLICIAPETETQQTKNKKEEKINSLATLMLYCFNNSPLKEYFDNEAKLFEFGNPEQHHTKGEPESVTEKITTYPSVNRGSRLKISSKSRDFWLQDHQLSDSKLNYGLIMHDVLRQITQKSDQSKVLNAMISSGRINMEEGEYIRLEMEKFWNLSQVSEWFSGEAVILNERDILTDMGVYRPDRVILKGKKATVVDYKFGEKEREEYLQQVKKYMQLISEIGYKTEGYVCYVSLGKVVTIQSS